MPDGFGLNIDFSSFNKALNSADEKLKKLAATSESTAKTINDAFLRASEGGIKQMVDSLSSINKSLGEINSKGGGSIANLGKGASSAANNVNALSNAFEGLNRSKQSNDGVFSLLSKINIDLIEAKNRFKELQKEFTHLSSPAGDKSRHMAIQEEVQFIMEYISVLKQQKKEIISTQQEIDKANMRSSKEGPFSRLMADYNGTSLEVKRYKDAMKAMRDFYTEQDREAKKSIKDAEKNASEEAKAYRRSYEERAKAYREQNRKKNQTYEGSLAFSESAKTVNRQIVAIKNLEAARNSLSRTDSDYEQKVRRLNREIQRHQREIDKTKGKVGELGKSHRGLMDISGQLARKLALVFSVSQITGYVKKLAEVRGEFELQQRSLQAIVQNVDEANKLWDKTVALAVKSPFRVKELVTYTKQLAAYRIETDKLYDTTKMLADVSAGLGVDMNRLILAYGQVRSAAYLRGTELRQFTEAGIPILEQLSKYFTEIEGRAISVGDVFERISKRMVSFADVEEIFKRMTSEGGTFYNMQEIQAETVKGLMSNLRDSIDIMLNDIGKANDETIKNSIASIKKLIENWRDLAFAIKLTLVPLGTYMGVTSAIRFANGAFSQTLLSMAMDFKKTSEWIVKAEKSIVKFVLKMGLGQTAASGFAKALGGLASLGIAGIIAGIVAGIVVLITKLTSASREAKRLNKELNNMFSSDTANLKSQIRNYESLVAQLENVNEGSSEHKDIISKLNSQYGEYLGFLVTEKTTYDELAKSIDGVVNALTQKAKMATFEKAYAKVIEETQTKINGFQKTIKRDILLKGLSFEDEEGGSGLALVPTSEQINDIFNLIDKKVRETGEKIETATALSNVLTEYFGKKVKVTTTNTKALMDMSTQILLQKEKELELDEQIQSIYGENLRSSAEAREAFAELEKRETKALKEAKGKPKWIQEEIKLKFAKEKIDLQVEYENLDEEVADFRKQNLEAINGTVKDINTKIRDSVDELGEKYANLIYIDSLESKKSISEIAKSTAEAYKSQQDIIKQLNGLKDAGTEYDEKELENAELTSKAYYYKLQLLGRLDLLDSKNKKTQEEKILNRRINLIKEMYNEYNKLYKVFGKDAEKMVSDAFELPFKEAFEGTSINLKGLLVDSETIKQAQKAGEQSGMVFSDAMLSQMKELEKAGTYIRGLSEDAFKAVKDKLKLDEGFVPYIYDDTDEGAVKKQIKTLEELYQYFDKVTGKIKENKDLGTLTIGYGHSLQSLDEAKKYLGVILEQHEAEQLLDQDIRDREKPLNDLLDQYKELIVTQEQYNVLFNAFYQGGLKQALVLASGDISKVHDHIKKLDTDLKQWGSSFAQEWGEGWLDEFSKLETFAERFAKLLEITSVTTRKKQGHIDKDLFYGDNAMKARSRNRYLAYSQGLDVIKLLEKHAISVSQIDFTNIEGVVNILKRLRPIAEKEGKEAVIALEKEISSFVAEIGITTKKDADQKIKDEVQSLFDQYEVSLTLKNLNVPKDFAKDVFKVDMITLDELKEKVVDTFVGAEEYGEAMRALAAKMELMFNGNVDLLNRKLIPAQKLAEKGWKDVGEGIATVFSSTYDIENAAGEMVKVMVTPILPDGSVMTEGELETYVNSVLQGAEDMLKADERGVVISVGLNAEQGEELHKMQEDYYKFVGMTSEKQKQLIDELNKGLSEINWTLVSDIIGGTQMEAVKKQMEELGKLQDKQTEENVKRFVKFLTQNLDKTKIILEQKGIDISFAKKMFDDGTINAQQFAEVVKNITKQANEEISKINLDKFKETSEYLQAMGNLSAYSVEELRNLKTSLDNLISANSEAFTVEEMKVYQDVLKKVSNQIDKIDDNLWFRDEDVRRIKEIKRIQGEIEDAKEEEANLNDKLTKQIAERANLEAKLSLAKSNKLRAQVEGGDTTDYDEQIVALTEGLVDINSQIVTTEGEIKKSKTLLSQLGEELENIMNAATPALSKLTSGFNIFNKTLALVSDSYAEIKDLAASFGADTESGAWKQTDNVLGMLEGFGVNAASAVTKFASGNVLGGIMDSVKAIFEVIKGINAIHDDIREEQIQENIKAVENLEKEYEKLGWVVDRALSFDRYGKVAEKTKNLGQQIKKTSESIALEEDKKNTDDERIKELKDNAEEARREIQELYDNLREEIVGSYEDLSSTLADSMIEALKNGEDALKAWSDSIDEIIGEIVTKLAVQKYVEPQVSAVLDEFYNKVLPKNAAAEKAFQRVQSLEVGTDEYENALAEWQRLNNEAIGELPSISEDAVNALISDLEAVGVSFEPIASAIAGLYDSNLEGLSALEKGISGITEDQADVLAAYWNAVRMSTASIDSKMDLILANMGMGADTENPMIIQLRAQTDYLRRIHDLFDPIIKRGAIVTRLES